MKWIDQAKLLLRKAGEDEFALSRLAGDSDCPDAILGFHAQQAVEKCLKAVLNSRQIAYRRTHELMELLDLLRESGLHIPAEVEDACRLSPFAVEFRYDEPPLSPAAPLDRTWALKCVQQVRLWAESFQGR